MNEPDEKSQKSALQLHKHAEPQSNVFDLTRAYHTLMRAYMRTTSATQESSRHGDTSQQAKYGNMTENDQCQS